MIRFDGHYRSEAQKHIRFVEGERKEEEYYLYYTFFPDGAWICKTSPAPAYGMAQFLRSIDTPSILEDPDADEPMMSNRELLYQSGTWRREDDLLHIEWHNSNLEQSPMQWAFSIVDEEELCTLMGEYSLRFTAH